MQSLCCYKLVLQSQWGFLHILLLTSAPQIDSTDLKQNVEVLSMAQKDDQVFLLTYFFDGAFNSSFPHKREHLVRIPTKCGLYNSTYLIFSVELFSYSLELDFTSVYTVSLNEDIFQYEVNELMPRHIITCKQWTYTVPSTSIKQRYLLFC